LAVFLTATVACPDCPHDDCLFDGAWSDPASDVEDMQEPPVADQVCPRGHVIEAVPYPGWSYYTEAG